MNIVDFLRAYNIEEGFGITEEDLYESLEDGTLVHEELFDSKRWWDDYLYVTRINNKYIRWYGARTTGDSTAEDKGYSYDPIENIREVYPRIEVVERVVYETKKEKEGDI